MELQGQFGRNRRLYDRGSKAEYRFLWRVITPRLPIIRDGQLALARWGNSRGHSRILPRTGWAWYDSIKRGDWLSLGAVPVVIPASYVLDGRNVWYMVTTGLEAILVPDEFGAAVAYLVCEPSSHYYKVMTSSDRMPRMIGQRI